jgi:hypothetical protein
MFFLLHTFGCFPSFPIIFPCAPSMSRLILGNMLLNWTDEPDIGFVGFSPALVVGGTQGRLIRLRVSGASKFG